VSVAAPPTHSPCAQKSALDRLLKKLGFVSGHRSYQGIALADGAQTFRFVSGHRFTGCGKSVFRDEESPQRLKPALKISRLSQR
jgi:hypothetical protein